MPSEFSTIAADAAEAVRRRLGVCEIGVRPLHTPDRTWHLVWGQQPLCEPFAGMVNTIVRQIEGDGGTAVAIAADATGRAWAMLIRLPFMVDLKPLRSALYVLLADRTHHTPDQVARLASGPGESAVLDAQDVFTTIAGRVGSAVSHLERQEH